MKKKYSFTLIELLIVLVIIGIAVTLAVPKYQKWVIRARGAEAMNNLRALSDSLWTYYLETSDFPPNEPPSYLLPSVLGVKVLNPSKYFSYWYNNGGRDQQRAIQLYAYDADAEINGPLGSTYIYTLHYYNYKISGDFTLIPMGQGWYRCYSHVVKTASGPGLSEDGWQ